MTTIGLIIMGVIVVAAMALSTQLVDWLENEEKK